MTFLFFSVVKFFLVVTFLSGLVYGVRFGVWFVRSSSNRQHFDLTELDDVFFYFCYLPEKALALYIVSFYCASQAPL